MTKNVQKRDNEYYLERLRSDHPPIYTDLRAGKFKNPSDAFIASGLRRRRSPLDHLRLAWSKASSAEQSAFKWEIGCTASTTTTLAAPSSSRVKSRPVAVSARMPVGKVLIPATLAAEVRQIMTRRQLKNGDVMREMGLGIRDASLGMALLRGTLVQESLLKALEIWVAAQIAK